MWKDFHKWHLFCVQHAASDKKQLPFLQDLFISFYSYDFITASSSAAFVCGYFKMCVFLFFYCIFLIVVL